MINLKLLVISPISIFSNVKDWINELLVNIKCPFCHKHNPVNLANSLPNLIVHSCDNCSNNWNVEYTEPSAGKYHYITLYNDKYMIDLNLHEKTTAFFDLSFPHGKELCFKLKELLPITPSNIDYWINKFLKLRIFS